VRLLSGMQLLNASKKFNVHTAYMSLYGTEIRICKLVVVIVDVFIFVVIERLNLPGMGSRLTLQRGILSTIDLTGGY
jgi:hypothetical protein